MQFTLRKGIQKGYRLCCGSTGLTPSKRETIILQYPDAVAGNIPWVFKPPDSVNRSVELLHVRECAVAVFRRPRLLRHPLTELHRCGANRAGAKRKLYLLTYLTVTQSAQAARALPSAKSRISKTLFIALAISRRCHRAESRPAVQLRLIRLYFRYPNQHSSV